MHVDPYRRPEVADVMSGGVEKLMARGVSKRAALHRIARKHGVNPRSVYALIARAEWIEGGAA